MSYPHSRMRGFTLVEVAIVLIIVGLILGGVFKGQALIENARVGSMAKELTGIQTAWYGFHDRYRSLPGDFARASTQIDAKALPGNGNGQVDTAQERAGLWQQLALAGFVAGSFDGNGSATGSATDVTCALGTCPANPYTGTYKISYATQASGATGAAHEISTGGGVPVGVLSRLDTRLDDGIASSGRFRVHAQFRQGCARNGEWDVAAGATDCAGVLRE